MPISRDMAIFVLTTTTQPITLPRAQQQYSYVYLYSQIAPAVARAITDCTHTCESTDYNPNCTQKCMINIIQIMHHKL